MSPTTYQAYCSKKLLSLLLHTELTGKVVDKTKIKNLLRENTALWIALVILAILGILFPGQIKHYPSYIDWNTILSLAGLMLITMGMKESGLYSRLSLRIVQHISTERTLALFFVSLSAFLSSFLTNDITLFIVVPLTFCTQKFIKNDLSKLIIFEALAVNAGSALTPIGNPQNIFLWHKWGNSFADFTAIMLPLFLISFMTLLVFTIIIFPGKKIDTCHDLPKKNVIHTNLFVSSLLMLIIFIFLLDKDLILWAFLVVIGFYILLFPRIILKSDWLLILLFIIIFLDLGQISSISQIKDLVNHLDLNKGHNVFIFSALLSQIISNVPASILASHFTDNYLAIAYGVNIGGNGLIIGSLANFIALRLVPKQNLLLKFHKYSVPFFIITGLLIILLF